MTRRKKVKGTNLHHRLPKSKGGGGGDNLIRVKISLHDAWHHLFHNYSPEEIAEIVNEWIPTNCKMVVERSHDQTEPLPKPPLPEVH